MDASTLSLKHVFEPTRRHIVPLFQRPYVWEEEAQWVPLWEDIRSLAERVADGGKVRPHFLGAIVLDQIRQPIDRVESRLVIDGQQRLTTLQLVLEAAADTCHQRGWERYHRAFAKLTRNEDPLSEAPDDVFKVWPTNTDRDAFTLVMKAESPEALQSNGPLVAKPLAQAYIFFTHRIREWLDEASDGQDRIGHLHTALREWVRLVVVDLGLDDDAQLIFETLNARGTPLLPADLVKNHLFHLAQKESSGDEKTLKHLYEHYWKRIDAETGYWRAQVKAGRVRRSRIDLFLQHYLSMRTGEEVLVTHLYDSCRSYLAHSQQPATAHLEDLNGYAAVFRDFDRFAPGTRLHAFFSRLDDLEVTTAHPLLLHLFSLGLEPAALEAAVTDIESFLMRRLVCRLTTKNYNRLFLDILNALRDTPGDIPANLRALLLAGSGDSVRWPNDKEFREAWLEMPVYRTLARRRVRLILEVLEQASRGPKTEILQIPQKLTIEHLMPQSWEAHWPLPAGSDPEQGRNARSRIIHTIGNLTLMTKALNPDVSNSAWKKKVPKLRKYALMVLTNEAAAVDEWNEKAIHARGERLWKLACEVWPRPAGGPPPDGPTPSYAALGSDLMSSEQPAERDLDYWARRCTRESLSIFEACRRIAEASCRGPRWTYAQSYIALGGALQNFAWFWPQRESTHCNIHVRVVRGKPSPYRDEVVARLRAAGLDAAPAAKRKVRIFLHEWEVTQHQDLLSEVLRDACDTMNPPGEAEADE